MPSQLAAFDCKMGYHKMVVTPNALSPLLTLLDTGQLCVDLRSLVQLLYPLHCFRIDDIFWYFLFGIAFVGTFLSLDYAHNGIVRGRQVEYQNKRLW